jgi:hypothetical protein|tara:strand:+ start:4213 stop:4365 length:153 start_codon:yes stop_codon:yes gene_type:complete
MRTLRQSSLKINFPSMGLPPTKIEAVISNVDEFKYDSEEEEFSSSLLFLK